MKLDITKIPGYKEEMTPEEQLKLIREHDIDLSGYVKKEVADRYASEAADYKKKYNATLGEQERKSAEDADRMKAMEDELNSLRRERAISKYTADYIGLGFEKELADATAKAFADGKTDVVFQNLAKHQESMQAKLKAELMQDTPKPDGGAAKNGGIDYAAKAQEALERGDTAASVYYTRLAQQNANT